MGSRRAENVTLEDRLRQLAAALPSDDSAILITRSDLVALLKDAALVEPTHDLTVEEVARETGRAASTVRGWLLDGGLRGYKLNRRDWRIPWPALREYLSTQGGMRTPPNEGGEVDITAWRRVVGND